MILKQAIGSPDDEPESPLLDSITFREKDAQLLREECAKKYNLYIQALAQKKELQAKLNALKEELNAISPDALQEIQKQCSQKAESDDNLQLKLKKSKINKNLLKNTKKNERRKRPQKLTYS